MKQIKYLLILFFIGNVFISCEEEEVARFQEENNGIEFYSSRVGAYSFKKTGKSMDTLMIPFHVVGLIADVERNVNMIIDKDSTTATSEEYQVIDALVEPNKDMGNIRVKVTNNKGTDFKSVRVFFRVGVNEHFMPGIDTNSYYDLEITNNLIRPIRWELNGWKEKYFLGSYSTAYYAFILEVTGETEFPYPWAIPSYNNGVKWGNGRVNALKAQIRYELDKRNKEAGSKLLHDDGGGVGKEVIVGKYYN